MAESKSKSQTGQRRSTAPNQEPIAKYRLGLARRPEKAGLQGGTALEFDTAPLSQEPTNLGLCFAFDRSLCRVQTVTRTSDLEGEQRNATPITACIYLAA